MRRSIFTVLFIIPFIAQAEEEKSRKSFLEDCYVGINLGPVFYTWKDKAPESNTKFLYNRRFSYTFGGEFVKPVSERILMSGGLQFTSMQFKRTEECKTCGEVEYTPKSFSRVNFLSVPINANFLIVNNKLDVIGIFGIENSFIKSAKTDRLEYDGSYSHSTSKNNFNSYLFGINAGIGFNYTVNYHFSWGMTMLYKQPINQIAHLPAVAAFGVGLNTGFYYKF